MSFISSTFGIDFLSGCYYINNELVGSIHESQIEKKEENGK